MIPYLERKYFLFSIPSGDIIKETDNDINVRCPVCGDSENRRKARGHFYMKGDMEYPVYHCFNCEFSGSLYTYLKEVNANLFEQYKKEKRETNFNSLREKKTQPEEFKGFEVTYKAKNTVKTFKFPNFLKAEESERATKYLESRQLPTKDIYYSKENIKFDEKYMPLKDCIIIPLWYDKENRLAFGFQSRSIEGKTFYTYIPDENSGYKVWNFFGIDKTKPTFVFESTFDALSSGLPIDRICAALGADLNSERISELNEAIFCFDNQFQDQTSKEKSLELLKKGYRVFVWDPSLVEKDANSWKQNHPTKNFAKIIIPNIMEGMKGSLKLKIS